MMHLLCPACAEATEHRFLFAKNDCDILQCAACGLARAEAGDFDPAQYYTSDYFSGGRSDGYSDYRSAEPIYRREFAHAVNFIRKFRPSGRLLEIGCAYGFLLEEARQAYDVAGIEIAEDAGDFCRQRGLRVLTGAVDESKLAELGPMDVIVMFSVIEHLTNPAETLRLCRRYLNPGGIIAITTGDIASVYARLTGPHWRLMTPPQHLWYFTPESMRRLSQSFDLRLELCDHPWKLVPLSVIMRQMRHMLGIRRPDAERGSRIGIPANLFDNMRCVLRNPG